MQQDQNYLQKLWETWIRQEEVGRLSTLHQLLLSLVSWWHYSVSTEIYWKHSSFSTHCYIFFYTSGNSKFYLQGSVKKIFSICIAEKLATSSWISCLAKNNHCFLLSRCIGNGEKKNSLELPLHLDWQDFRADLSGSYFPQLCILIDVVIVQATPPHWRVYVFLKIYQLCNSSISMKDYGEVET